MEGSDIPIALLGDGHHDKRSNGWDALPRRRPIGSVKTCRGSSDGSGVDPR